MKNKANVSMNTLGWVTGGLCIYFGGCVTTHVDKPDILEFGLFNLNLTFKAKDTHLSTISPEGTSLFL